MRKHVVAFVLAALLLCIASAWCLGAPMRPADQTGLGGPPAGGPGGPMPPPGMGPGFRPAPMDTMAALIPPPPSMLRSTRFAEQFKLTDDQKSKLSALMDSYQQNQMKLMDKVRECTRTLRQTLTDPSADRAKIESLTNDSQKAETAMAAAGIDLWMQIRAILTADQLKQLAQYTSNPGPGMMPPAGGPPVPGGMPPFNPPPPGGAMPPVGPGPSPGGVLPPR